MRALRVRPEASAEAQGAAEWYEERVVGLGSRWLGELDAALVVIRNSPNQFPVYHHDVRRARVRGFPYGVFFVSTKDEIVVLAVVHLARDPRLLRRKLGGI